MKNVNDIITLHYYTVLKLAVGPVKVFREYVAFDLVANADAYLLISGISNTPIPTFTNEETETTIQVSIYTRSLNDNDSSTLNTLAGAVYATIKPLSINVFPLTGFNVLSTELVNDVEQDPFDTGTYLFLSRSITFKHKIVHS